MCKEANDEGGGISIQNIGGVFILIFGGKYHSRKWYFKTIVNVRYPIECGEPDGGDLLSEVQAQQGGGGVCDHWW